MGFNHRMGDNGRYHHRHTTCPCCCPSCVYNNVGGGDGDYVHACCFDVYATGDSMANYINGGDAVGIDISDITPKDGEVYALFLDGDLMIKRIFKEAGGVIRLSSDNKQYTDKIVTQDNGDSLIIIGRVVYRSG